MERRMFVSILAGTVLGAASWGSAQTTAPRQPDQRPRWGQQAESEFGLGRGLAPKLMTEEEWREHQGKMRAMSAEERARYRQEVHERMMERAKEQGMALPRGPAGLGPGPGGGPGPRGGRGR
jgi:hypothetical protein